MTVSSKREKEREGSALRVGRVRQEVRVIKEFSSGNSERSLTPVKEGRCVLLLILHRCHLEEEKGWNHGSCLSVTNSCSGSEPGEPPLSPPSLCLPNAGGTPLRPFPRLLPHFINHTPWEIPAVCASFWTCNFKHSELCAETTSRISSKPDPPFSKWLPLTTQEKGTVEKPSHGSGEARVHYSCFEWWGDVFHPLLYRGTACARTQAPQLSSQSTV